MRLAGQRCGSTSEKPAGQVIVEHFFEDTAELYVWCLDGGSLNGLVAGISLEADIPFVKESSHGQ